jgi:HSP20 family protein
MALPIRRSQPAVAGWDPLAGVGRLGSQLMSLAGAFTPLADVEETDDAYLVEIELAGVKQEDLSVEIAGSRLTVTGERKERERAGILRRRTRTVGRFHYEVDLPGRVEEDEVSADMHEGVLTVRLPKVAADRPRRIAVS